MRYSCQRKDIDRLHVFMKAELPISNDMFSEQRRCPRVAPQSHKISIWDALARHENMQIPFQHMERIQIWKKEEGVHLALFRMRWDNRRKMPVCEFFSLETNKQRERERTAARQREEDGWIQWRESDLKRSAVNVQQHPVWHILSQKSVVAAELQLCTLTLSDNTLEQFLIGLPGTHTVLQN